MSIFNATLQGMDHSVKGDILVIFLILLILANIYLWQFIFSLDGNLKVLFFDVGEGDSIFIRTPQGHQILIDGGPGERILDKLPKVMPFWDRSIDLVILTHPDSDHLSGLIRVLADYKIGYILWNGIETDANLYKEWLNALKIEGAQEIVAQKGLLVRAGGVKMFVLAPMGRMVGRFFEQSSNESSVVAKLVFGNNSFLFTGDIAQKEEKDLARVYAPDNSLVADVLKVAHHGSKTATSKDFLVAVAPKLAVISCGLKDRYGHPHQEVLSNLREFGINILRTDELGDITITADGSKVYAPSF